MRQTRFEYRNGGTSLAIYLSWRNVLRAKIVEHDLYLDRIAIEALVHLGRLDKVADVGHSVRVGICETDGNTAVLHANSAEENLAHVAFRRGGRVGCEQIFAVEEAQLSGVKRITDEKDGRPISTASMSGRRTIVHRPGVLWI